MVGDLAGKDVLDAGCGQGYLCRLLAARGAAVLGVEPARRLIEYAERREAELHRGIRYLRRDLSRLGNVGGPFDAVVANIVFLDIADWRASLISCVAALRPSGRLVYSLHHPCWVCGQLSTCATRGYVEMREYLSEHEQVGEAGVNFHRPLSAYVNATIELGCAITEIASRASTRASRERGAETPRPRPPTTSSSPLRIHDIRPGSRASLRRRQPRPVPAARPDAAMCA